MLTPEERQIHETIDGLVMIMEENSPAYCCFHIVLDDGNHLPENVNFCIQYAREAACQWCIPIAEALERLPPEQRVSALYGCSSLHSPDAVSCPRCAPKDAGAPCCVHSQIASLQQQLDEANQEIQEYADLLEKLSGLLTATVNTLRGKPRGWSWSWDDLPKLAGRFRDLLDSDSSVKRLELTTQLDSDYRDMTKRVERNPHYKGPDSDDSDSDE